MRWYNFTKSIASLGATRQTNKYPKIFSRKDFLLSNINDGKKILDVGAGRKWVGKFLENKRDVNYKSMDIDREVAHDYYSLDEINETFDFVIIFDVIEHLPLKETLENLEKMNSLLKKGGKIIISIPNIYYLGNVYHTTCHHVENYSYIDLFGFLNSFNYNNIEIFRLTERVLKLSPKLPAILIRHIIRKTILFSFPHSDYATDIIISAEK